MKFGGCFFGVISLGIRGCFFFGMSFPRRSCVFQSKYLASIKKILCLCLLGLTLKKTGDRRGILRLPGNVCVIQAYLKNSDSGKRRKKDDGHSSRRKPRRQFSGGSGSTQNKRVVKDFFPRGLGLSRSRTALIRGFS